MTNKKIGNISNGFTLIELLVVIAIIALLMSMLLPALKKGQQTAAIDRAKAEMAALAGTEDMVHNDCGWYVRLCDLSIPTPSSLPMTTSTYPVPNTNNTTTGPWIFGSTGSLQELTSPETVISTWNGPYQVFQATDIYISGKQGSLPTIPSSGPGSNWGTLNVPNGCPLDPWGHPYLLAWNNTYHVMIIYSAGPDGIMETNPGDTTSPAGSDNLVYEFR